MATVGEIMVKKVAMINEGESLKAVCKILISQKVSGVPVINTDGGLVGFVSERDIIQALSSKDFQNKKVLDVMTRKVLSAEESAPVDRIAQLFTNNPFRYIPITKKGRLVGIVSRKDVIDKLLGQYY